MKTMRLFLPRALLGACAILFLATGASAGPSPGTTARSQTAVLAGGCFWGMELVFESLKGVSRVVAGYSGGSQDTAQYEVVGTGRTGHAESVQVTYDPAVVSYRQLLDVYFRIAHDPTERDRQGPDAGSQYRSVVFYATDEQKREANAAIRALRESKAFSEPIVTEVVPLRAFYPAEGYHQRFAERNPSDPYIVYNDAPKVVQLRLHFPQLVRAGT